jgi:hypothetical protein
MPKFNMQDYTGVNDRMRLAADTWQTIVVSPPVMLTDVAGYVSATVVLKDGRSVTEIAAFRLNLTGASAQANFPIEDAATSAVGRALGRFGFGTDTNFPSREEMQQVERVTQPPPVQTINQNLKRKAEITPAQARAKFYEYFGPSLCHPEVEPSWSDVRRLLGLEADEDEPTTVDHWRQVSRLVNDAIAAETEQAE